MNSVKNLIFDLDGTLIDSSDGVVEAINYSFEKMGLPKQETRLLKSYIGYPLSVVYRELSDAPVEELYRHFQVKAAESVVASTVPLPGVNETLEVLAKTGYKMAIGTTKIKRHTVGIIEKLGWTDYFCANVGGDEVEKVKPAPDIFELTLKRMKGSTANSIVVGDTVNDLHSAKSAGMRMVGVRSPYDGYERLKDAGPDFWIETIGELVRLLRNGAGENR